MINRICKKILNITMPDRLYKEDSVLNQELTLLAFGSKQAIRKYYQKKIKRIGLFLFAAVILTAMCLFGEAVAGHGNIMKYLMRPGYGAGDKMEFLEVQADGWKEKHEMEVVVSERVYTDEEKRGFLEQAIQELEKILPGENVSMDEVRKNLVLPVSLVNDKVKISWTAVPYGVVDEDGTLIGAEDKNGTLVELQGTMNCGTMEQIYTIYAKVFPPILSEEEQLKSDIQDAVELANLNKRHEEILELPEEAAGRTLVWHQNKDSAAGIVFVMMMLTAFCMYVQMDQEVHKQAEKRRYQLMIDYPDLMWKMTMLLGAGQSMRGTFIRMAEEYRKKEMPVRWVYEEVCITCAEMQSGISEAQAYERFGKRCQLPEYIRLGTVLSQNLKKGSKGLTGMLEKEAEIAMNERKNHARKIGEQAGTKLLLPMILMLGVVLAILMIPAFLSF